MITKSLKWHPGWVIVYKLNKYVMEFIALENIGLGVTLTQIPAEVRCKELPNIKKVRKQKPTHYLSATL